MTDVVEQGRSVTSGVLGYNAVNATLSKIDAGGRLIIPAHARRLSSLSMAAQSC